MVASMETSLERERGQIGHERKIAQHCGAKQGASEPENYCSGRTHFLTLAVNMVSKCGRVAAANSAPPERLIQIPGFQKRPQKMLY